MYSSYIVLQAFTLSVLDYMALHVQKRPKIMQEMAKNLSKVGGYHS